VRNMVVVRVRMLAMLVEGGFGLEVNGSGCVSRGDLKERGQRWLLSSLLTALPGLLKVLSSILTALQTRLRNRTPNLVYVIICEHARVVSWRWAVKGG
jgi:hypothetical protein